jgi:hypothetical protein
MRFNKLIAAIAICGIFAVSAKALGPDRDLKKSAKMSTKVAAPVGQTVPPTISDACPATDIGTVTSGDVVFGDNLTSADDFDNTLWPDCGATELGGGQDEIFQFQVDTAGAWELSTCFAQTWFDSSLGLFEETGGGCPGDYVTCNSDAAGCGGRSIIENAILLPSNTYYVIVDSYYSYYYYGAPGCVADGSCVYQTTGEFALQFTLTQELCQVDGDCDDGLFCTGVETCDTNTGACVAGSSPCLSYQACDEVGSTCVDPDPCYSWQTPEIGSSFFPQANNCPGASWVADDAQLATHTTRNLNWYEQSFFGRDFAGDAQGTVVLVDMALWTVEDATCLPLAQIPGTQCTEAGFILAGGSDPDKLHCEPAPGVVLPDNSGDFNKCEIDVFTAYNTGVQGFGFGISGGAKLIGGTGIEDEIGGSRFFLEDCNTPGLWSTANFAAPTVNDFGEAIICTAPEGTCCDGAGGCSLTTEADCTGTWGAQIGSIPDGPAACEGDVDGDGLDGVCGDNCPDDANPGQEDCDGDGEGDACEADSADQDADGDGVCNGIDNCPFTPNAGQENGDGDAAGDACDPCPVDANDDSDGDGSCDSADLCPGFDDNLDADGDGVPDDCDVCPGNDDNAAGAQDDTDGDGVINCNDLCNGVDDAVFGPECEGAIPTVSEWGLVILALLLLAAGKVYFGRRDALA